MTYILKIDTDAIEILEGISTLISVIPIVTRRIQFTNIILTYYYFETVQRDIGGEFGEGAGKVKKSSHSGNSEYDVTDV